MAVAEVQGVFYVSPAGSDDDPGTEGRPFSTVTRARDAVRELVASGLTGDIVVYLRGGVYTLSAPLAFDERDCGTSSNAVTYAAYPGETPVLSGGRTISGTWSNVAQNIWRVPIPDVQSGAWWFRELWHDETRLAFKNAETVTFHTWSCDRTNPSCSASSNNVPNAGEWALDKDSGYLYVNTGGSDPNSQTYVAGNLQKLIVASGSGTNSKIVNMTFKGLHLLYTDWPLPPEGFLEGWAGTYAGGEISVAVEVECADGVTLEGLHAVHLGGQGLGFGRAVSNSRIVGCLVADASGGGIINGWAGNYSPLFFWDYNMGDPDVDTCWGGPGMAPSHNAITDNYVHHIGRVYYGCEGIKLSGVKYPDVQYNYVHNTPYNGIDVSDITGGTRDERPIKNNHVRNAMEMASSGIYDGLALYESDNNGMDISSNYVHDSGGYGSGYAGFYLDIRGDNQYLAGNVVHGFPCLAYVHTSTGHVFQSNLLNPTEEQIASAYNSTGPRSPYREDLMVGPIASNDTGTAEANHVAIIPVLANDREPDEQAWPISVRALTQPVQGVTAVIGDAISYTSTNACAGTDVFTYVIGNRFGSTATATVTVAVAADVTPPSLLSAACPGNLNTVLVSFDERVQADAGTNGAENAANYEIDNGVSVVSAQLLSEDGSRARLTTSPMGSGTNYTLTVNHVGDLGIPANAVAANSKAVFSPMAPGRMWIGLGGCSPAAELTGFPVLVVLGTNRSGFAYSQFASEKGWDLRFKAADGVTELPYDIEEWNTNGLSYVWVLVPSLTSNTWITAWWGDTNRAVQQSWTTNGAAWENQYRGVWHFNESAGTTVYDATSNRTEGVLSGGVTVNAPGVVAGGDRYDGGSGLATMANEDRFDFGTNMFCVSFWIKNAKFTPSRKEWTIVSKGMYNQAGGWEIEISTWSATPSAGTYLLKAAYPGYVGAPRAGTLVPSNGWHHIALVRSGAVMSAYCDGAFKETATNADYGADLSNAYPLRIGQPIFDSVGFGGSLDELRLAGACRSPAWLRAEYVNVVSNDTVVVYGPVDNLFMTPYEEWRFAHFTAAQRTELEVSGTAADPDLDGMTNDEEYRAGTNPANPCSRLVLAEAVAPPAEPGKFVVRWQSSSNRLYVLEAATNLYDGFTISLGTNIVATPAVNVFTDRTENAALKFYRVKVAE